MKRNIILNIKYNFKIHFKYYYIMYLYIYLNVKKFITDRFETFGKIITRANYNSVLEEYKTQWDDMGQIEDDGIEGLLPIKYPYCHCGAKME